MNIVTRNITYFFIIALSILVLNYISPSNKTSPKGIYLPITKNQTPILPAKVKVFSHPPLHYKEMGLIRIQTHYQRPSILKERLLLLNAKTMAARAGANGLLVLQVDHNKPNMGGSAMQTYILTAHAIQVA